MVCRNPYSARTIRSVLATSILSGLIQLSAHHSLLAADTTENDAIAAAMKLAGTNLAQIQAALDQAPEAQRRGVRFLIANMPESDLKSLSTEFLLEHTDYAYRAWNESPWKAAVPEEIFLDYILPYANVDERRDRWRKDFRERFLPLVKEAETPGRAGVLLNQKLWHLLKVQFSTARPKANQSPYETIDAKIASCTGLAILLVDACRAVGVPARFVGTPRWSDKSGNHSWVEIWNDGGWHYTGAAEPAGDKLDEVWFGGRAAQAVTDEPIYAIYATRFSKSPLQFPLLWTRPVGMVNAVNVTERYKRRNPKPADGQVVVRVRVIDKKLGQRTIADVQLLDSQGKTVVEAKSRDEGFDPNDHIEAAVAKGEALRIVAKQGERAAETTITPQETEQLVTVELE